MFCHTITVLLFTNLHILEVMENVGQVKAMAGDTNVQVRTISQNINERFDKMEGKYV